MVSKPKIKINAGDIVPDLRSGMTDSELMEKYHLSSRGLQSTFRKLVAGGFLHPDELVNRVPWYDDTADIRDMRLHPRETAAVPVAVCEQGNPSNRGVVRNFASRGLGTRGLRAEVNEVKDLVVLGDDFGELEPFEFRATCRWVKYDGAAWVAGFEITEIREDGLAELRKFLRHRSLRMVDSGEWAALTEDHP
ncbi:MAG: PilZ domain-containing protein [Desulfomonile tiedjei]|nr:PilZ domain-containing protein [Desulfomonile tiedjei]